MMKNQVALYMRLSQEDVDKKKNKIKDESNSIVSQRLLLTRHLDLDPMLCGLPRLEFIDDGFSGTNFDRPAFKKMIELTRNGEISVIVVKDLSRFGRDYLGVGDYLEHVFPFLGVRFKSINDHYDSIKFDGKTVGMDIAFRNLIYDYYSRDLSKKVKTAMSLKQNKGEYVNCVPYGYRRSDAQKHSMVLDETAAEVVREVFSRVIAGESTSSVAQVLNDRGVLTPSDYKQVSRTTSVQHQWTHARVVYMIRNIKYTGVMINHTRESRKIRDKNQRRLPPEEWVIKENAHEPIISKEDWEKANDMLRKVRKSTRTAHDTSDRVFYCGHCRRKLQKTYGADEYYSCLSAKYHEDIPCSGIRWSKTQLEEVLLAALQAQVALVKVEKNKPASIIDESRACFKQIEAIDRSIAAVKADKLNQYEAYRADKLSREKFIAIKDSLAEKQAALDAEKTRLTEAYEKLLADRERQKEVKQGVRQAEQLIADATIGLTAHLYDAINRVMVYDNEHIQIEWKFDNVFEQKST